MQDDQLEAAALLPLAVEVVVTVVVNERLVHVV